MTALARWCAERRWYVVGAWVLALIALAAGALSTGDGFSGSSTSSATESSRAGNLMASAGLPSGNGGGKIVWHTDSGSVQDPAVRGEVTTALTRIADLPGVAAVVDPYAQPQAAGQLNAAAGTAYATVAITSADSVDQIRDIAAGLDGDRLQVAVGGQAFTEQPAAGGGTEGIGILAALVILLLVFRSAWAAVLPIVTGIVGVGASLLSLILLSHLTTLSSNVITMGALVGLGVGIDYALFIVNRHRRALMSGKSVQDAVAEALNTSGRAVVFAGATVIIALLGVVVVDIDILTGMARGAALAVLLTVAAATTLLPALLSVIGVRVLSRRQRRDLAAGTPTATGATTAAGATLSERWSALVQRAPRRLGVLGLLLMLLLASPAVSLRLGSADAGSDPVGSATREYADLMGAGFGDGVDATLSLVARTPDAASQQAFTDLSTRLPSVRDVAAVGPVLTGTTPDGQTVSAVTVTPASSAQTEATANLVTTLREDVVPAAAGGTGTQVLVGGTTAGSIDSAQDVLSKLPLFLGLVALLGFLLLVVAFRSVVVPLVGALGNLLTLAVGLGVLVAAFQWGGLTEVLQLGGAAPVESLVPVLTIGIMFGLSMDYQVFLVSRMHEEHHRTGDNTAAVRVGLAETARVIVTAAAIMFFVFAAFGFAGQRIVAEIGVGLAVAVLADAFLLRLTVIPALMHLIGRRNWSYPRWAERITPRVSIEGGDPSGESAGDADGAPVVPLSRGRHSARPAGRGTEPAGFDRR